MMGIFMTIYRCEKNHRWGAELHWTWLNDAVLSNTEVLNMIERCSAVLIAKRCNCRSYRQPTRGLSWSSYHRWSTDDTSSRIVESFILSCCRFYAYSWLMYRITDIDDIKQMELISYVKISLFIFIWSIYRIMEIWTLLINQGILSDVIHFVHLLHLLHPIGSH